MAATCFSGKMLVVAGDLTVSGTLYAEKIVVEVDETVTGSLSISGSLIVSQSATMRSGLVVNESGGGADANDFRVESTNEANAIFLNAGSDILHINKGKSAFETKIWSNVDNALEVNSSGVVINENAHAANDFRVETDNETHALFVNAGTDQVIFHSSSAVPTDVSFYVSGSTGHTTGISLFGGDLVTSGALRVGASGVGQQVTFYGNDAAAIGVTWDPTGAETPGADESGGALVLGQNSEGADFIAFGKSVNNYMLWDASDNELRVLGGQQHWGGNVIFNDAAGAYDFRVENQNQVGALLIDGGTEQIGLLTDGGSAAVAYGLNASTDPIPADTNLFVSGAIGSRDSSTKGTAIFGGDVVVSGSLVM